MSVPDSYRDFLEALRKASGIDSFVSDESGLVSVRVDDAYNLNLQIIEATGKVLCFVEVAELPPDAPRAVYRRLLSAGLFGKDTAGGYFTLEPETDTVIYNYFFDLKTAADDVDDFIRTIEKILQLCDFWAERIKDGMSSEQHEPADKIPAKHMIRA
jgi:hypothetical protein